MLDHTQYIMDENTFQFLNDTLYCSTHKNKKATSICLDCKIFCCLDDNCGQPHIYHNIDNVDYLIDNQIVPLLKNYMEINKNVNENYTKRMLNLNQFKNNLKNFAIEEKRKVDDDYKNIIMNIQNIYNNYMEGINEFIESLSVRFDTVHEKAESVGKNNSIGMFFKINFSLGYDEIFK